MRTLKSMWLEKIGVKEWRRIERWVRWSAETYGRAYPKRDRIIKPLLALNGQQIEPDTALMVVWYFGLEIDAMPTRSIEEGDWCDYLSCRMEEEKGLRVHYDSRNKRLYIAETDNPRTTFDWLSNRLKNGPTACEIPGLYTLDLPTLEGWV